VADNSPLKVRGARGVMNKQAAHNPPLKIRGVRGVMNEQVADNPPLKIRGVRGVINEQRDPEGPHHRQVGGELCPKQRKSRFR